MREYIGRIHQQPKRHRREVQATRAALRRLRAQVRELREVSVTDGTHIDQLWDLAGDLRALKSNPSSRQWREERWV